MTTFLKYVALLALYVGMALFWEIPPITEWRFWPGVLCFAVYATLAGARA